MFGIDDAALALIAAGAISTAGSLYANSANRKAQAHINDVNWQIAAQNNATQVDMANTAHQREVRDLKAAGLNPILSASGNGSPTPTLQSPDLGASQVSNPLEGLASSARGLKDYVGNAYKQQREQTKAMELSNRVAAANSKAEFDNAEADMYAAELRRDAMRELAGWKDSKSKYGIIQVHDGATRKDSKELVKKQWRSSMDASQNPFNWLPFANSAGSMLHNLRGQPFFNKWR